MIGDAGDDVCEPRLGIDAVEASGFDERVHDGGAPAAVVGASEEIVFAPESHRPFILPVLGSTSRFITAGTRCTANEFICITVRYEPALG